MGSSRSWRRVGVQLGILAGVGLALVQGIEPSRAAPLCSAEGQCTFTKPLFLIAVDYSTAMNAMFDADKTRWQAAVAAVEALVDSDNGYLQGNALIALMRFGHDPEPDQPGTTIAGDASGLVDGQRLDVGWYDPLAPDKDYFHCNGEAIKAALQATPPPLDGAQAGIGAWTAGAQARAQALLAEAAADHPDDPKGPREAVLVVITQGAWSDAEGAQMLQPPAADPAPVAADMWQNSAIPTFVLSVGDAEGTGHANTLAAAGGTGEAAVQASSLTKALSQQVQEIQNNVEPPVCVPGIPRIMFILDASSSMLNVMGDSVHGAMGETRWDWLGTAGIAQALELPSPPLFDGGVPIHGWSLVGAAVFGGDAPAEQRLLFDYGSCRGAALPWVLDPANSCVQPGCVDPWGGPPIAWTFQSTEIGWAEPTTVESHAPRCDDDPQKPGACAGSGSFVHLGLELAQSNLAAYAASCSGPGAVEPCAPGTKFYNVLVTDGVYESSDAEVEAALTQMFDAGVRTYVIGLGELADEPAAIEQLTMMAAWGSGGQLDFFDADSQVELQAALAQIFAHLFTEALAETTIDPCCEALGCGPFPGQAVSEPDPVPQPMTESDSDAASDSEATSLGETTETTGPGTSTETGATTGTSDAPTSGGEVPTSDGEPPATSGTPGTSAGPTSDGDPGTDSDSGGEMQDGDAKEGCGCAADGAGGPPALLVGLGLLALGRRRRGAR